MKRQISVLLGVMFVLSCLTACGNAESENTDIPSFEKSVQESSSPNNSEEEQQGLVLEESTENNFVESGDNMK